MLDHVNSQPSANEQPHPQSTIQYVLHWGSGMLPPTIGDFDWLLSEIPGEINLLISLLLVTITGHALVSLNISPYSSPSHLMLCRVQHNNQPLLHCVTSKFLKGKWCVWS